MVGSGLDLPSEGAERIRDGASIARSLPRLVPVQPVSTRVEGAFEVALCGVTNAAWGRRVEEPHHTVSGDLTTVLEDLPQPGLIPAFAIQPSTTTAQRLIG